MGLLDNVLGSGVPGGRMAKPLGIALLALLASRMGQGGGGGGGLLGGGSDRPAMSEEELGNHMPGAISGGLGGLLRQFQQNGYGHVADSWIGRGPNQQIAPDQLHQALGPETVDELSEQTGMPRQDVLSQLSQALPDMVDRLTPEGRIPDPGEVERWQENQRV